MLLGLEVLLKHSNVHRAWGNCALLCNQASVSQTFSSSWQVLHDLLGVRLKAFFGPQHGFHATVQDNMIETSHAMVGPFGLPVYSLYSETREPLEWMLDGIDTIIIDIQIVGCRVYTFKYTMAACMRAAKKFGKRVVVLDRPNPLGGKFVEGRVLDPSAQSFVGEFPLPLRHSLTTAEAAKFFNKTIGCELDIVPMSGWEPEAIWSDYYKHWVLTSPNLPTIESVYIYPSTVMLEGTNLSEGRGTGLPFQFVGAPYIKNSEKFRKRVLDYIATDAIHLRAAEFQPTSQKWAGEVCRGFQIHILNPREIPTFSLGIAIIRAAIDLEPQEFAWKNPPYEYDHVNLPINLILGSLEAHEHLLKSDFSTCDEFWHEGLPRFVSSIQDSVLYPREIQSL